MEVKDIRIRIGDLSKLPGIGKKTVEAAIEFVSEHPGAFGVSLAEGAAGATVYLHNPDTNELKVTTRGAMTNQPGWEEVEEDEYRELEHEKEIYNNQEDMVDMDEWIEKRDELFNELNDAGQTIATLIDLIREAGHTPDIKTLKKWQDELENEEDDLSWL